MDNFEYSILLNDRDWAEFYSASEECHLILPALATSEEQVLSDLEEGEPEENSSIRVRVGPVPAHDAASCLPCKAPDTRLFAEDAWSGSEDETDLVSVSRFLCRSDHHQGGGGFPHSSCTGECQLPRAALKPLQSRCGEASLVPELEAVFAAKEGKPEKGKRAINLDHPPAVEAAFPLQEENSQEQNPEHQGAEILTCSAGMNLEATEGMENPVGEKENASLGLELQLPKEETGSVDVPTPTESVAISRNTEPPASTRAVFSPSSLAPEPGRIEDPEKNAKPLQVVLTTEARPFQQKPSVFQERLGPSRKALAPLDAKSHGETPPERVSWREESAMDLKKGDDGRKDVSCPILGGRQADQGRSSTYPKAEHPFPGGLEGNMSPNPTQAVDSSCDKTLDKHRDTAGSAGTAEEGHSKEHCRHLGLDASVPEGPYPVIEGGRRPEFGGKSILYGLTAEDSLGRNLAGMTLPETYEYFFGEDDNNTKEEGGPTREGRPSSHAATGLPDMDGPEMYEYFFSEMDRVKEGPTGKATETFLSSDRQSPPPSGLEDPSSAAAAAANMPISIPEVYEHFFAGGARERRNWRGFLLSVPAAEARKAARALKSLLCRPVRRLRSQPTSPGALLRRSSQGKLVLLSPLFIEGSRLRPGDGEAGVMQPGNKSFCFMEVDF